MYVALYIWFAYLNVALKAGFFKLKSLLDYYNKFCQIYVSVRLHLLNALLFSSGFVLLLISVDASSVKVHFSKCAMYLLMPSVKVNDASLMKVHCG